uniref:NADH dehydrogenase [ubiquinone] 1 beta subcomplex subunit 11, mitochondrial n=1 Tax=Vombatus ursinus TaxID=29139 RepID=A0A4X2JZD9_VOMUR
MEAMRVIVSMAVAWGKQEGACHYSSLLAFHHDWSYSCLLTIKRQPLEPEVCSQEDPKAESDNLYERYLDSHSVDKDPVIDLWNMKVMLFLIFSVAIALVATFVTYLPDYKMKEWAGGEAELQEAQSLPFIDSNYFHLSKIILPDDDN